MVVVDHLVSPASLPKAPFGVNQLSVLTWNILLPNSVDGWWTYKMYSAPADNEGISSWDYRRNLLKQRIGTINADVVCLQEISPGSFEQDFDFMEELGYDGYELFKKGRFRPATFWKTSECRLVTPAVHKDRCLLTAFEKRIVDIDDKDETSSSTTTTTFTVPPSPLQKQQQQQQQTHQQNWYVLNCHLQAGKQGPRRLRQLLEGIKGVLTLARKQKEVTPETNCRLIVCGDFNGGPESGSIRILEDGWIEPTFLEDGEPVTSSRKELPLKQPLQDAAAAVSEGRSSSPPPTLVVAELMSSLMDDPSYENAVLSKDMEARLTRIYKTLATREDGQMSRGDVEKWLLRINKEVGRGDEFRNAATAMGFVDPNTDDPWEDRKQRVKLPEDGILTLDGFIDVYQKELAGGKFWGIAWDM
jgi:endonuclease/exonuclease/phosphatase family metal-dependent hydrolase